jgi:hypothetical protein
MTLGIKFVAVLAVLVAPSALAQSAQHEHTPGMSHDGPVVATPVQAGQAAFAAVQEIAELLERAPDVDWQKVDLEALRQHLIDMDNVTLRARIESREVEGGASFTVIGEGDVKASILRMVPAHAATVDGQHGWRFAHEPHPSGAVVTVRAAQEADVAKIRGLGFIGLLARGMHHQQHHLMIALGDAPHH